MLVRIFKTNQVYIYVFIPLVLLALRWPVLANDPPFTPSGQLPFLSDLFAWLSFHPILSLLLGMTAIVYQSYLLAELSNEQGLTPYSSNLGAFVLAILYSVFAPQNWFSPVIFANVFTLLALGKILNIYQQGDIRGLLFRVGIYISLASIIYLPSSLMLLVLFYDLSIIRTFHWREYVIPFLGLITPFLYLWVFYFQRNSTGIFWNYFIEPKTFLSILEFEILNWIPALVTIGIILLSLAHIFSTSHKRTVRQNNLFKVMMVYFFMNLFASFMLFKDFMSASGLIWIPLAILITYYLLNIERKWWREGLVYTLLIFILLRDILTLN